MGRKTKPNFWIQSRHLLAGKSLLQSRSPAFGAAEVFCTTGKNGERPTVSLQKIHGLEQLAEMPVDISIIDLGRRLDETAGVFMDTAAVIKNFDLIISSDTALPHLAGALGVPVWLLLPHIPDWRWGLSGENYPWYPTIRLFRQPEKGNWDAVLGRVAKELEVLVSSQ